jgi:uncharacterized glyoxalase superfamily protein PhnB
MNANADRMGTTVVPALRYRDLPGAIDWLCAAFGFETQRVVPAPDGGVLYAQLTLGHGMVMLAPVTGSAFDQLMCQPDETGGAETQICYFCVEDALAHYERARAAGAEIVLDITDSPYGGQGYTCRDPEGHIWNFGTFDPWRSGEARPRARTWGAGLRRTALVSAVSATLIACGVAAGWMVNPAHLARALEGAAHDTSGAMDAEAAALLARERAAREAAEQAAKEAREQLLRQTGAGGAEPQIAASLEQERLARKAAERAAEEARTQLAGERNIRKAAERIIDTAREQLAAEREDKEALEQARAQLEKERAALQRAVRDARFQLVRERRARRAAQKSNLTTVYGMP